MAGVCVSDQVCASFMCGMWHVHYPFLKERYIKEIKKSSSAKKKVFFSASHSPLSDPRFNLSTYQQLTIADLVSELVEKCAILFVVCGMFITLF